MWGLCSACLLLCCFCLKAAVWLWLHVVEQAGARNREYIACLSVGAPSCGALQSTGRVQQHLLLCKFSAVKRCLRLVTGDDEPFCACGQQHSDLPDVFNRLWIWRRATCCCFGFLKRAMQSWSTAGVDWPADRLTGLASSAQSSAWYCTALHSQVRRSRATAEGPHVASVSSGCISLGADAAAGPSATCDAATPREA